MSKSLLLDLRRTLIGTQYARVLIIRNETLQKFSPSFANTTPDFGGLLLLTFSLQMRTTVNIGLSSGFVAFGSLDEGIFRDVTWSVV